MMGSSRLLAGVAVVGVVGFGCSITSAFALPLLTHAEMAGLCGGQPPCPNDERCLIVGFSPELPEKGGARGDPSNPCPPEGERESIPDEFCAEACAHTVWWCCWDAANQKCTEALAMNRKCVGPFYTGWTCWEEEPYDQCDSDDPAWCCWVVSRGKVVEDKCVDCDDAGLGDCDQEDCDEDAP